MLRESCAESPNQWPLPFTVMDALAEGFAVTLIVDGIRGVDMHEGDTRAAIQAMRAAGAECVDSSALAAHG